MTEKTEFHRSRRKTNQRCRARTGEEKSTNRSRALSAESPFNRSCGAIELDQLMKTISASIILVMLFSNVLAQTTEPTAVERGPHHAVWRTVTATRNEVGKLVSETNSFVEVATGLNYWNPMTQQWEESQEKFEITAAGHAIAVKGQCQLLLAADINSGG